MTRVAHHRSDFRNGPHHSWRQRRTYHLSKLFRVVTTSVAILRSMRPLVGGGWDLPPALVGAWREAIDDAIPYVQDETGEVWS